MPHSTPPPAKLHGLPVLSREAAAAADYQSISNICNTATEYDLMDSMSLFRNPERTCWIHITGTQYELARKYADLCHCTE